MKSTTIATCILLLASTNLASTNLFAQDKPTSVDKKQAKELVAPALITGMEPGWSELKFDDFVNINLQRRYVER